MDDMIVKSSKKKLHEGHLTNVFNHMQHYNMRLILENYTCAIRDGKILGPPFQVSHGGLAFSSLS